MIQIQHLSGHFMKQPSKKQGLWAIIKPVKFEIRISMFLASLGAMSLIAALLILSLMLSNLVKGTPLELFGIEFRLFNAIVLLTCIMIMAFVSRLYSFVVSHLGAFRLEQILRTRLSQHLAQVPLGYIITHGSGDLKKAMQEDVRALHAFVADTIPMIAKSIIAPLTTLVVLIVIDYRFALVSIGVLILGWIAIAFSMKDSQELRENYLQSQSEINKSIIEFAQAMPVVRTFDDGTSSFSRYNTSLLNFKENLHKWMQLSATSAKIGMLILSPLPTLLAILISGVIFLNNDSLNLFTFIAALFLSTTMADAMMQVMWLQNFIKKSQASAIRIQEILNVTPLSIAQEPKIPDHFSIQFKEVSFAYEGKEEKALNHINFTVPQGSITALVGPSGAGKSTVAKLIPRFWDIHEGQICIGEVNIKDIEPCTLMNTVSFVFQDTFLFQDTLYNNIKMARLSATQEEVIQAAKAAQIHDFIQTLPNGYETMAGERGTNLSGGQKQRITIARAILRDAPIVVLDEATAFADPQSEEEIIKALANLMENKTVIMIAHRLSTIKDADQIIVFNHAKIEEVGKHDELLTNKGTYEKLWSNYQKASCWNLEKGVVNAAS
jgi:ATP-binding cassette subfamily B protein